MVDHLSIGVLGIQGAISEHVLMMKQVINKRRQNSKVSIIRRKIEINGISKKNYLFLWSGGRKSIWSLSCQPRARGDEKGFSLQAMLS